MWEYCRFEFKTDTINELIIKLNKLGDENWEIIHYEEQKPKKFGEHYEIIIILKRLKPA